MLLVFSYQCTDGQKPRNTRKIKAQRIDKNTYTGV